MKPFLLGVIADLRSQRLLPVAILLVAALVAVPVLLGRAPEPAPPVASAPVVETTPDGLPSPDAALTGDPLVTMASLEGSSDLDSFDTRNPFKPLKSLDQVEAGRGLDGGSSDLADAGSGLGGGTDLASSGDSGDSGEPSPGSGGGSPPSPEPDPSPSPSPSPTPDLMPQPDLDPDLVPQPDLDPDLDPDPQRLTYAIDVSFAGPESSRRVRALPRLAMLPHASVPLLIFLGVSAGGDEAMFLVDSKLHAGDGEGMCRPSPERCATVGLEPGERQAFVDDEGRGYVLQLDQIRAVSVEQAIRSRRSADARAAGAGAEPSPQRFLPVLVDALIGG